MLEFIKKCFFYRISIFIDFHGRKFVELYFKNQKCKVRPQILNVNGDDPMFFPFSIKTSKCSGSCNNINNPLAKLCVPHVINKKLKR